MSPVELEPQGLNGWPFMVTAMKKLALESRFLWKCKMWDGDLLCLSQYVIMKCDYMNLQISQINIYWRLRSILL